MKVAYLVQWHPTRQSGLVNQFATAMADRGMEVRYYSGIPAGRHAMNSHYFSKVADWGVGLPAVRYPYFHSHDGSGVRRFATYSSFALRSSASFRDLGWADVVLVYCSPATAVAAAMLARRWRGVPYVMMVQDVWPDSIFATGFVESATARRVAERTVGGFVSAAYRSAAAITAQSPGMRGLLVARGAAPERTHVLFNWARQELPVTPRVRGARDPLHLMYAGNIGPGQDLGNVLRALTLLPEGTARLSLVGEGADAPRLRRLAADLGLGATVSFVGQVPLEEVPATLGTADVHLVSLADEEIFRITVPSKLQSLMAMALPVLSSAPGEVGRLVAESGCGFTAPPDDPRALAETVSQAAAMKPTDLADMGARGAAFYHAQMSRQAGTDKLAGILEQVANDQ